MTARLALLMLVVALTGKAQVSSHARAQSPTPEPEATSPIDLSERLTSPNYSTRKSAMVDSWRDYRASRDAVWQLARSGDAEAEARAQWILDRWEIGLMADLPPEVREELARAQVDPAAALSVLISRGHLREAAEVARHHHIAQSPPDVQRQIADAVARQYTELIHTGLRNDQMDVVLDLLDHSAEYDALIAARAVLLQKLDQPLTAETVLPVCTGDWPIAARQTAAVRALATAGELELAADLAEQYERADLASSVAIAAGDWTQLSRIAEQSTDPNMPVEVTVLQYAVWLVAATEAGLDDQADQAAQALLEAKAPLDLRWRSLLVAGRITEALQVAREINPDGAADILTGLQRPTEAFELLGISPATPLPDVRRLIDEAFDPTAKDDPQPALFGRQSTPRASLRSILTAVRLLRSVGANPEFAAALRHLGEVDNNANGSWDGARVAATLADRYGMPELAAEILAEVASPISQEVGFLMGSILTDGNPDVFRALAQGVALIRPELNSRDHWLTTIQLASGTLPELWDPQIDLDALYDRTVRTELPGMVRTEYRASFPLGDIFAQLGRGDLAQQIYRSAAQSGTPNALLQYADQLLQRGNADAALKAYRQAYERAHSTSPAARFQTRNRRLQSLIADRNALAGQAAALAASGRHDQAQLAWQALDLMPFHPNDNRPEDYLERLSKLGFSERRYQHAPFTLRYAVFDRDQSPSQFYTAAMTLAGELEAQQPEAAARWWRIALIGSLSDDVLYANGYLHVVAQWHVLDSLAALQQRDEEAAAKALRLSLRFYPLNIDLAESHLDSFRQQGFTQLADATLESLLETGTAYVRRQPRDANTLNNLAWVAALNGRADDRALAWSRRAVLLVPDSTSYRDTMAEVLFRMGRNQEAAEIERQCLLDEPDDWHLHEQLTRFAQPNTP